MINFFMKQNIALCIQLYAQMEHYLHFALTAFSYMLRCMLPAGLVQNYNNYLCSYTYIYMIYNLAMYSYQSFCNTWDSYLWKFVLIQVKGQQLLLNQTICVTGCQLATASQLARSQVGRQLAILYSCPCTYQFRVYSVLISVFIQFYCQLAKCHIDSKFLK